MNAKLPNPDSNAVALDFRNFGVLPDELRADWTRGFLRVKKLLPPPPRKAIIELVNTCNYDCPMCRVGQFGVNLHRCLPYSDFSRILQQLTGVTVVRLNGLGESTLLPNFLNYVEEIIRLDKRIELITNGSGSLAQYETILAAQGKILISWDAALPELFEKLRRPAKWSESIEKARQVACTRERLSSKSTLALLFTLQSANIRELSPLVQLCKDIGFDEVVVNVVKQKTEWVTRFYSSIVAEIEIARRIAQDVGVHLRFPNHIAGHQIDVSGAASTSSTHCTAPWDEVLIRWNGDVQVCNMFNPYTYGNIFLTSFEEIWSGYFATLFRDKINTKNRHPYCVGCVYFQEAYE